MITWSNDPLILVPEPQLGIGPTSRSQCFNFPQYKARPIQIIKNTLLKSDDATSK